jgi:hypothetical protein
MATKINARSACRDVPAIDFLPGPIFSVSSRIMILPTQKIVLALLTLCTAPLLARVGETEAAVEARYGKPVSKQAWTAIERDYDEKHAPSPEERKRNLEFRRLDSPGDFHPDGTLIDFVGEDAMVQAEGRLVFFNPGTEKWEDLRSKVIGRRPEKDDNEAMRRLTANARKHLRQRFYILNGIGISVVYLGGRSVSEAYHQKHHHFADDFANELIRKSFPDGVFKEAERDGKSSLRLIRILNPEEKELRGCATYVDGMLTVTATPYFGFLKAMEDGLVRNAELREKSRLEGF